MSDATLRLGYHPETKEPFSVESVDRQSGTVVTGVTGAGKSGLLTNNIVAEATTSNTAIFVIDPHGDLTKDCIARFPEAALARTYVLDMEDENHPFGVNALPRAQATTAMLRRGLLT